MHLVVKTSSNLIEPGEVASDLSPEEIAQRTYGSKIVLVVEQMQILTIWLIKACLLIMYRRMTFVLPQRRIVIGTAIYVALGFVVMEVLYFAVCETQSSSSSITSNDEIADKKNQEQCNAATNHLITNAVFNMSSDLLILSIPIPVLFRVRLPKKNKAILIAVFMIGAFNIVAAVLNKYYSFTNPFGTEWTIWYLRESYTAIFCANLPLIYPLIQRVFHLRNWSGETYVSGGGADAQHPDPSTTTPRRSRLRHHLAWSRHRPPPTTPAHRCFRGVVVGPGENEDRDRAGQMVGHNSVEQQQRGGQAADLVTTASFDRCVELRVPTCAAAALDTRANWRVAEKKREQGADIYHVV
ncbi:hypothetical protein ACEQ8H_005175 [Pleosporales sp. CAS-2024a]